MRRRTAPEFGLLAVVFGLALIAWFFIELVDEVREGDTHRIDRAILLALRSESSPRWLIEIARDITALGSAAVLILFVAMAAIFLALSGKSRLAGLVVGATASATAVMSSLKVVIDRPRPDVIPHDFLLSTASFPSGHTMLAAMVYLTLGGLIARAVVGGLKIYVLMAAALLAGLVGISRLYLAVHWPTDVLAGWAAGAAWALMCWMIARTEAFEES